MADHDDYCLDLVREFDKDRFLASLFAPRQYRAGLMALYAFDIEISRAADRLREPIAGEIRLQWWHDVVTGREHAAGSPVATALIQAMNVFHLPADDLVAALEGYRASLEADRPATIADIRSQAEATSGTVFQLASHLLNDGPLPAIGALARAAGRAFAITRSVAGQSAAARRNLAVPDATAKSARPGPDDAPSQASGAARELLSGAAADLAETREMLVQAPEKIWPAYLPLAVTRALLERISRRAHQPSEVVTLPHWRRQWIIWRAARNLPQAL